MSAELTFDRAGRVQSGEGAVRCRAFYLAYPGIVATASHQSRSAPVASIWETPSPESHTPGNTMLSTSSFSHLDGLPLCTEKDHTVVKHALAGMSNPLFVSWYKVALPSEAELQGMLGEVLL